MQEREREGVKKCDADSDHCKKKQQSTKESLSASGVGDFEVKREISPARLRENELQCKKHARGDQE